VAETHTVARVGRLVDQVLSPKAHVQLAGHALAEEAGRHAQNIVPALGKNVFFE